VADAFSSDPLQRRYAAADARAEAAVLGAIAGTTSATGGADLADDATALGAANVARRRRELADRRASRAAQQDGLIRSLLAFGPRQRKLRAHAMRSPEAAERYINEKILPAGESEAALVQELSKLKFPGQ
jgi:hypothetical protein